MHCSFVLFLMVYLVVGNLGPGHTVVSCLCDSGQVRECGNMNFTSKKTLEPMIFHFHRKTKRNLGFETKFRVGINFKNLVFVSPK